MRTVEYFLDNPTVLVTPKDGDDFSHEFVGEVICVRNDNMVVRDGDDNYIEVDLDQLRAYPEDD